VSEIVAFIKDRLDDDEFVARQALHPDAKEPGVWMAEPHDSDDNDPDRCHIAEDRKGHYWSVAHEVFIPNAEHIARHDPARVLSEIAAKRGVVREMESARKNLEERGINVPFFITWTLMHLAKVYADHPDYKRDWHID
jgi:hypothetical protein